MATALKFFKDGRSIKSGVEVSVHWSGFMSGFSKYRTDSSGCVYIEDERISGSERKADKLFVDNPSGGHSLKYTDYVITKGSEHHLHLESADS